MASLVPKPPPSPKSCMHEWQEALRAARSASKLTEPVQELSQPKSPDVSLLRVGSCGWDDCSGLFERTAHLDFQKDPGLVFIRYIEHLGWCLVGFGISQSAWLLKLGTPSFVRAEIWPCGAFFFSVLLLSPGVCLQMCSP